MLWIGTFHAIMYLNMFCFVNVLPDYITSELILDHTSEDHSVNCVQCYSSLLSML